MTQARKSRIAARLWIPLAGVAAVAVALLQGLGVFAVWGFGGSFLRDRRGARRDSGRDRGGAAGRDPQKSR